jgi:hypothetical protein
MIKYVRMNRPIIDAHASMIETLTASEALPLDDPGQATLTGRLQALALLAVAEGLGDVGSLIGESGLVEVTGAIEGLAQTLAGPQR